MNDSISDYERREQEINWNIDTVYGTLQRKYETYNKVLEYIILHLH